MRPLLVIAMLLTLAVVAEAASVRLAWDPMPVGAGWAQVRVYERIGTSYVLVASTATGTENVITVPNVKDGSHFYVVRSWNNQRESDNSNEVTAIVLVIKTPTGLSISITSP